jgi:hypothetical protein
MERLNQIGGNFVKKIVTTCFSLALALMCSVSAFALEVPTETTVQNLNGIQQYIKVYTVSPDTDPQSLLEDPFDYEGFTYSFADITKQENFFENAETHTETVTVETAKKDLSAVLAALEPTMAYDDGQYQGTLSLDHTTIQTQAAGYVSKSYTITETKEIGNLDSNDMAYVPASTMKNGQSLQLSSVDWQVQGTALVDDILVPSQYKAVATYSGKASYSAATGYITTANYEGEVSCHQLDSITYTVIYVGAPTSEEDDTQNGTKLDGIISQLGAHWPLILGALAVIGLTAAGGTLLLKRHRNSLDVAENDDEETEEDTEHED